MKFLYSYILVLHVLVVSAQEKNEYYEKVPKKDMYISTSMCRNLFGLVLSGKGSALGDNTYFLPNKIANFSVGVSHPKVPFDINIGTGIGIIREDFPDTKSLDIQVHSYSKRFVIDAFYQKYSGFYIDKYKKFLEDRTLTFADRSFPGLKMMLIGATGQYIFNSDEFSYQAGFNNTKEVQLRSAGTILVGGSFYFLDLNSVKPFIGSVKQRKEFQYGVSTGYSYNIVFSKEWLANLSASLGANLNRKWDFKPTFLVRASCFYTSGKWSYGAIAFTNILSVFSTDDIYGTINSGLVSLNMTRTITLKKNKKIKK